MVIPMSNILPGDILIFKLYELSEEIYTGRVKKIKFGDITSLHLERVILVDQMNGRSIAKAVFHDKEEFTRLSMNELGHIQIRRQEVIKNLGNYHVSLTPSKGYDACDRFIAMRKFEEDYPEYMI